MYVCMYEFMYVRMHECIIYTYMYVPMCLCVFMYVCRPVYSVCMYVCMYVRMYQCNNGCSLEHDFPTPVRLFSDRSKTFQYEQKIF